MGVLNIGTQALQANLVALQTTGNNIANVNTPGYSRQKTVLQALAGQFSGGGYIGKGVAVQTIQRNFSEFLTRQSTLASSAQFADTTRASNLKQLEDIFEGGKSGLGASINDMMNAFSDVATAPTDLTARTVALTRVDETAARMRAASQRLDDLQAGVTQEIKEKTNAVNSLAKSIGEVNNEIARVTGTGQPPNDLLDRRDQLVRELNQYVQTTSIAADDGTVGVFIGGSQALVLGTKVSEVSVVRDDFGDLLKNKIAINRDGVAVTVDENTLGGGEISGLLRFQNSDLNESRNLLGRLTMGISTSMNTQHKLGIDLDGKVGTDLFTPISFTGLNILKPVSPAILNKGNAELTLEIGDTSQFVASDYEINFNSPTTGTIKRRSDGLITSFPQTPAPAAPVLAELDGLKISMPPPTNAPVSGDRFLIKPFSTSASNITSQFATPRALAVASPIAVSAGTTNHVSLATSSLLAKTLATPSDNYSINFTGPTTFDIVNTTTATTVAAAQTYVPGQAITYDPGGIPGWSLTLTGAAVAGDTFTVQNNPYPTLNAGNANAMMSLRDAPMFDGAALTDGYAGMISQIGIRTQSANYAAEVSSSISSNLEKDRTGVSGVNLDEEAAKLLQFQQAYQASAKMMQIAQSIFDTLMRNFG